MKSKLKNKPSRADVVYSKLREAILEQALAPGIKLPEDVIGAHFGVSRTLVRAALSKLNTEGLVDIRPKRSATVAHPSIEEAREVFAVRRCLELEVIPLLIAHWNSEIEAQLRAHVAAEEDAAAKAPSLSIRLAGEFHIKLAELSGSALLLRYVTELVSRCSLILSLYGRPHSSECAVNDHHTFIEALASGDTRRAVKFMETHLDAVKDRALLTDGPVDASDLEAILAYRFPNEVLT